MNVLFFNDELEQFIKRLQKPTVAKLLRTIDLLERFGHSLQMPHAKRMDGQLFELRVRGQQEIRIFYVFRGENIVLLHGFIKKSQRIPDKELKTVKVKLKNLLT